MNSKSKGFTLVELIATIFLISLLLSIGAVSIIGIINRSNEKSIILSENNIKKSANLFAKEYEDNIVWELDDENNMYSCVSVKTLTEMGYLKKENALSYESEYVKVVKEDNNIIYEEIDKDNEVCENINNNQIKIPTSKNLCNKLSYSGLEQSLINQDKLEQKDNDYVYDLYVNNELKSVDDIKEINAGTYKIEFKLKDGYLWSDNSKENKTIDCTINKAIPILQLNPLGTGSSTLGITTTKFKSSISGKIQLKSSDLNYVVPSLNTNLVEANVETDININVLATRDTNTYVTITLIPSDEYKNNYYTNSIVYTVGNIEKGKLKKPDSTFCKNVYYNNTSQELIEPKDGYKYYNYIAQEVGSYTITAVPKYGYVWEDNTSDEVSFVCEMKEDIYTITLDDQGATTKGSEAVYLKYNTGIYLDRTLSKKMTTSKNKITLPTRTGYTFEGYYTEKNGGGKQLITKGGLITKNFTNKLYRENKTIYAKWTANTYTITYRQGKGESSEGTSKLTTSKCTYDSVCTLKKYSGTFPSSSTSWSFYGWTLEKTGKEIKYNNNAKFTYTFAKNITLYAIGRREIKFYSGITPTTRSNTTTIYQYWNPYSTKVAYLTSIKLPSATSIPSWNFIGYAFGSSTASPDKITYNSSYVGKSVTPKYNAKRTVRSVYERNLTLTFNANSGTGTIKPLTKVQYYNSGYASDNKNNGANVTTPTFKLPKNTFTKEGYNFNKWAEGSAGGTKYAANKNYSNFSPKVDLTTTTKKMYATWTAKTYTITLNNQSATTAGTSKIYGKYDSGLYLKSNYTKKMTTEKNGIDVPKRTGYTYGGYYTKKKGEGTQRITKEGFIKNTFTSNTYTENKTLYAKWTAKKFTIKFDANGGSTPSFKTKKVTYDQKYGDLPTTTHSKKKFDGWYDAKSGGNKITASSIVKITKDKTFYAHWKEETMTIKLYSHNCNGTSSDCVDTGARCDREPVDISGYTKFKVIFRKHQGNCTPPTQQAWGEVELRQGTSGSEGKGTKIVESGKEYNEQPIDTGWLNVSSYFSSSNVSLLCLAVGYTGDASCEVTFKS